MKIARKFRHISLEYYLLFGILVAGFLLRVSGISWGLPYLYHPDENQVVTPYLMMIKSHSFNPHWFAYPGLVLYLNGFLYGVYFLIQFALGNFHGGKDIAFPLIQVLGSGYIADANIYYLGRSVSILFGMGTILISYRCAKEISSSSWVGLLAATFTAISNANIVQSRLILPNIYVTFFTTLTIWFSLQVYKTGQIRHYLLAGAAIGLTTASKYNGCLVAVTLLTAHFCRTGFQGWKNKKLYLSAAVTILVFLMLNIYILLDYPDFMRDFKILNSTYAAGLPGVGDSPFAWYITYLGKYEPLTTIAAFAGILYAFWKRNWLAIITAIFPSIYFPFINLFKNANEQTLLPMLPAMLIMASWFLGCIYDRGIARYPHKMTLVRTGTAALLIAAFAFPFRQTLSNCNSAYQIDSRATARVWIANNIPPGSKIALEPYTPYIEPKNFQVVELHLGQTPDIQWFQDNHIQYVVFGGGTFKRYYNYPDKYAETIARYEWLFQTFRTIKIFNDGGYEVRIYQVNDP